MTKMNQWAKAWVLAAAMVTAGPIAPSTLWAEQTMAPVNSKAYEAKAQAAIDKGLAYLKSKQQENGSWQATPRDPIAFTALALKAFAADEKTGAKADFVKKGYDNLLSFQVDDGGIYKEQLASYNTAIAISALVAANDPAYAEAIKKASDYLKSLQWTGNTRGAKGEAIENEADAWYGGWGYGGFSRGGGRPDLSNAQIALEALSSAGVDKDDPAMKNALQFITRLQNNSETNNADWAGNDGGFIYGPNDNRKGESFGGEYAGPDGRRMLRSYGSMTYAGLKSMIYAGLTKDDPRVKAAWQWVTKNWTLEEHPGLAQNNAEARRWGIFYYYNTLAKALNVYDEPVIVDATTGRKHDWRVELIDKLAGLQAEDGSWTGEKKWMEENPLLTTAYTVQALQEALADLKQHPAK